MMCGAVVFCLFCKPLFAQHEHGGHGASGVTMPARDASGTSWQPASTPHEGVHFALEEWAMMAHGVANFIYDKQNGKRGDEAMFSSSMFMLMAERPLGNDSLRLRAMLFFDPFMGRTGYPLLLQSGETADGVTHLIDRQHPHDIFMELSGVYTRTLSEDASLYLYLGLPGEPALGPPVFMHRFSGMDIPAAPITHHWLDSTHVTYGVATFGYVWKTMKLEGSAFNGREPDQDHFDIESPKLASGSVRLSFNPSLDWSMQASFGYLDSPEALAPEADTRRTTVSVSYNKNLSDGNWQTTLAWGRNDNLSGNELDGFLLESAMCLRKTHTFFGRAERVAKDELFKEGDPLDGAVFNVHKITLGYIYDFPAWKHATCGIGSSVDLHIIPDKMDLGYGDDPVGYMVFIRIKLAS